VSNDQSIHVEDASLSTVSIEVKVLRIGKKQMTLAVFRQLPKRELIDEAGNIVGVPWGHVNYHQDCPEEEHLQALAHIACTKLACYTDFAELRHGFPRCPRCPRSAGSIVRGCPGLHVQLANNTRRRNRSTLARPYICRLISFTLVTCPSTCPLLHATVAAARTAS
jgi:hypothetical protein